MCILLVTVSIINSHDIIESNSLYHIRCFADNKDVAALTYSSFGSPAKFVVLRVDDKTLVSKRLVISKTTNVINDVGFSNIVSHALRIIYNF